MRRAATADPMTVQIILERIGTVAIRIATRMTTAIAAATKTASMPAVTGLSTELKIL